MNTTNPYCHALGIPVPHLEQAARVPDANSSSLLIVALLERGEPMTLEEVAARFEGAGVAPAERALASLKRCRPARAPIYRDGNRYALDPHDHDTDLWTFRLGLRPPKAPPLTLVRPEPPPLPPPETPLTVGELDQALRDGLSGAWSARQAVRERVATIRRWADLRPDPVVLEAQRKRFERERAEHAERLARMRRVLVHAYPAAAPKAMVLVDVGRRQVRTFLGEEVVQAAGQLAEYDIIAAVDVRAFLRTLHFDPGERRLGELEPPHKTTRLNRWGRTLKITLSMLVRGSCGISRPFGEERVLRGYLRDGKDTKLRRRLEADAKSLFALYQYGRLHGAVRLRWGFLDEMIPAPWVHP